MVRERWLTRRVVRGMPSAVSCAVFECRGVHLVPVMQGCASWCRSVHCRPERRVVRNKEVQGCALGADDAELCMDVQSGALNVGAQCCAHTSAELCARLVKCRVVQESGLLVLGRRVVR